MQEIVAHIVQSFDLDVVFSSVQGFSREWLRVYCGCSRNCPQYHQQADEVVGVRLHRYAGLVCVQGWISRPHLRRPRLGLGGRNGKEIFY